MNVKALVAGATHRANGGAWIDAATPVDVRPAGPLAWVRRTSSRMAAGLQANRKRKQLERSLRSLLAYDDRMLDDMGLHRGRIEQMIERSERRA